MKEGIWVHVVDPYNSEDKLIYAHEFSVSYYSGANRLFGGNTTLIKHDQKEHLTQILREIAKMVLAGERMIVIQRERGKRDYEVVACLHV